ncbi:MAG: hypothetical protein K2O00_08605 [Muribaculaceae bacterium]|nr:hypothetical protein [Muribaculaceae bacterium]
MKKFFSVLVAMLCVAVMGVSAQVITTSPALLQEKSKNVVLTFHADQCGVAALQNLPSSTPLYVHIGVTTNKSNGTWKYVQTDWSVSNAANQLKYVSKNTYSFTIPDLRTYFKMTDASETISKIAFIARTANGSAQTKDLFIDVLPEGFQIALTSNVESYVINKATTITFTVNSTENAQLTLDVDGTSIGTATGNSLTKSHTFSAQGYYKVNATGTFNGTTLKKTITVAWPRASQAGTYPGGVPKQGAVRNGDGTVTFCLAAPGKTSVILIPSWDNYETMNKNVMKYQDYQGNRYFFITVSGLNTTTAYPYYYLVDGVTKVADPYAHLVLDPYSDKWLTDDVYPDRPRYPYEQMDDAMLAVYQENIDDFKFSNFTIPDHKNLVIYEMLFRDFTGTDATADGTFKAAIEKIPYLAEMGVNCVELLPVMEFSGNNSWGYNTNFYMAPDKSYGSPKELKQFIEACHCNGIAVVLDIVFNQSDGLHPWYQMYPIASNPFYNATAPHDYSVLNDWKQDHALVKQQWKDALTYWMTKYNVDGFRFDLVKGLGNNGSYSGGTEAYNSSRVANMKALNAVIKSIKPNGIHINENLAGDREENEMAADGQLNWSNVNDASGKYAQAVANVDNQMSGFYAPYWNRTAFSTVSYAESHDEQRIGYYASQHSALKNNINMRMRRLGSIAAQMLITPGPKMIWQFAELGAEESTKNSGGNNTDPKLVCWDNLNDQYRKALYQNYKELCHLRQDNAELFTSADVQYIRSGYANNITSARSIRLTKGDKELILLVNPAVSGNKSVSAAVTKISSGNYQLMSASEGFDRNTVPTFASGKITVTVPANSYVIYGSKATLGVDEVFTDGDSDVIVKGGYGEIIILGEYDNVQVYTISGQAVNSLNVAPGMYIVNVDGNVHKVIVH